MLSFVLKKLVGTACMPLSATLFFLAAGMIMLLFTRRQIAARISLAAGFLLLLFSSYGILFSWPLEKLENEYPPFDIRTSGTDCKWVVVLAGGPDETMVRLIEGIRIMRDIDGSKLVVSGGRVFGPVPSARIMADAAQGLGVDPSNIVLEDISRDTKDEAMIIRDIVQKDAFVLVTSAYHMPRSMALFQGQGLNPVPAPTQYFTSEKKNLDPWTFFPSTENLRKAEVVVHEILGLIAAGIMGQI
jgi:uncharacterized SAM-binding protein YcdF (DUF218 family)